MRRFVTLAAVVPLALAVGCAKESPPPQSSLAPVAPVADHAPAKMPVTAAGLTFTLPAGWRQQAVTSSMRVAQAAIPGSGGEAILTVFYFGPGGGGGVEANLERWADQVEPAPGTQPSREQLEVGDLRVYVVDVRGTLKPSGMGTGPSEPQPDARLLGAVVEGPGGPWFFKATGPDATLGPAREKFVDLLRSLRAAS